MAHGDTARLAAQESIAGSLEKIVGSLEKLVVLSTPQPMVIDEPPTVEEIVQAGILTRNDVTYQVITRGDEGYIRIEISGGPTGA